MYTEKMVMLKGMIKRSVYPLTQGARGISLADFYTFGVLLHHVESLGL